jgi:hypothetical protein
MQDHRASAFCRAGRSAYLVIGLDSDCSEYANGLFSRHVFLGAG